VAASYHGNSFSQPSPEAFRPSDIFHFDSASQYNNNNSITELNQTFDNQIHNISYCSDANGFSESQYNTCPGSGDMMVDTACQNWLNATIQAEATFPNPYTSSNPTYAQEYFSSSTTTRNMMTSQWHQAADHQRQYQFEVE
jgi:hypothetical protein